MGEKTATVAGTAETVRDIGSDILPAVAGTAVVSEVKRLSKGVHFDKSQNISMWIPRGHYLLLICSAYY